MEGDDVINEETKAGERKYEEKVVVIGGGWAGCAAALEAVKKGCETTLIEKTDLLLGLGNVGGIMRNNGRYTAAEENIAMGAWELFEITDRLSTHRNVNFPGHEHASFYDVAFVEPEVRRLLIKKGVKIFFCTRVTGISVGNGKSTDAPRNIKSVTAVVHNKDGSLTEKQFSGDVFIEATGSTGPMGNCAKYGNGCSMCILRCPAFGPRVSITQLAGGDDVYGLRKDGTPGAFSGSCKLEKRTLSVDIQKKLEREGFCVIPLPAHLVNKGKLGQKVCQQYALEQFAENLILIDTGQAKLMTSYFNLEELRTIEGFENAGYADPYAGGKANSVRYMSVGHRDEYMRAVNVGGICNLLLAGEKSGFFVGHTEAITTGTLAGYNGAMLSKGKPPLSITRELAIGDFLSFTKEAMAQEDGMSRRFTFAGGEYFERMKEKGLYTINTDEIEKRVYKAGLLHIYK